MLGLAIEVDIFCVCILLILLFDLKKRDSTKDQKLFNIFVINAIVFCLCDLVYYLHNGKEGVLSKIMLYSSNIIYFISLCTATYLWLLFVFEKIGLHKGKKGKWRYIWSIPVVVLSILSILTPVFPIFFSINENNNYVRGNAIWAVWAICWGYVVVATIYVIHFLVKEKDKKRRKEYISLLGFSVFPFAASLLQVFFSESASMQIGFTLAPTFVYVRLQDTHIWTDTLTGLSNRKYFEHYLVDKLKSIDARKPMFLMMIDIDNFRQLNDLLGHEAGDQVLKHLAYILEDEAKERGRIQVARYDGDEFALFGYDYDVKETEELIKAIQDKIERQNIENSSYSIEISIGYIRATKDSFMNTDQLMDIADAEMRKNKELKKNKDANR